jgi:hypothetical protein
VKRVLDLIATYSLLIRIETAFTVLGFPGWHKGLGLFSRTSKKKSHRCPRGMDRKLFEEIKQTRNNRPSRQKSSPFSPIERSTITNTPMQLEVQRNHERTRSVRFGIYSALRSRGIA